MELSLEWEFFMPLLWPGKLSKEVNMIEATARADLKITKGKMTSVHG